MNTLLLSVQPAAGGDPAMFIQVVPYILLLFVFYFLLIRPQQKRAKAHQAKIASVTKGNEVVTGGGLIGKVTRVADDYIEVEIANGVKVKVVPSTLADIRGPQTKAAND